MPADFGVLRGATGRASGKGAATVANGIATSNGVGEGDELATAAFGDAPAAILGSALRRIFQPTPAATDSSAMVPMTAAAVRRALVAGTPGLVFAEGAIVPIGA
jgi:hypothetical protein